MYAQKKNALDLQTIQEISASLKQYVTEDNLSDVVLERQGFEQRARMSSTNYNWTPQHPRFVADLTSDGRADIVGIGPDCVWSALNDGPLGFQQPQFGIVAFEANAGWRVRGHPRFVVDLNGDGRADILGFGDAGPWTAFANGDGTFRDFRRGSYR